MSLIDRLRYKISINEDGRALIELVFCFPIIVLVVAALSDLSLTIMTNYNVEQASSAIVRMYENTPDYSSITDSDTRGLIEQECPALIGSNYHIDVNVGETNVESYKARSYEPTGALKEVDTTISSTPISVRVSLSRPFFTSIGSSLSRLSGGNGDLTASYVCNGIIDTTGI